MHNHLTALFLWRRLERSVSFVLLGLLCWVGLFPGASNSAAQTSNPPAPFQINLVASPDQNLPYSVDLNTRRPAGVSTLTNWAVTGSAGPVSITAAGVLSVPARYGWVQQVVPVAATDDSGNRLSGFVSVNLVVASFSGSFNALISQAEPALESRFDLNTLQAALPGSVWSRAWQFSPGQELPSWISLTGNGMISGVPPLNSSTGSKDYVVEVSANDGSMSKAYGKVSVNLLAFSASLLGDANQEGGSSVNLRSLIPASAGLTSSARWSFANPAGTPLPGYLLLSNDGILNVPQYSQVRGEVLVKATEGTKTVLGKVLINAVWLGAGSTVSVQVGASGNWINLNTLPNLTLNGTASNRTWAWTSGQQIPSWINLSGESGQLSLDPASTDSVVTLYLDQKVTDAGGVSITTSKLTIGPVSYSAPFFADAYLFAPPQNSIVVPLSQLAAQSGQNFPDASDWTLLEGQQDWVTQGVTLSASGSLTVSADAINHMEGRNIFARATSSGGSFTASVSLRADYPSIVPFYSVAGGFGSQTLNLDGLPFVQYPGWNRNWAVTAGGGGLPEGVNLSPGGMLAFPQIPESAQAGTAPFYVDFVGTQPAGGAPMLHTLKIVWDSVKASSPLVWDSNEKVPLNLNALFSSSLTSSGSLSWSFVPGQNADTTSGWTLTPSGILTRQNGATEGVLLVRATLPGQGGGGTATQEPSAVWDAALQFQVVYTQFSAALEVVAGQQGWGPQSGLEKDLSLLLGGPAAPGSFWRFTQNQPVVAGWMGLDSVGIFRASPAQGVSSGSYSVYVEAAAGSQAGTPSVSQVKTGKVTVDVLAFRSALFGDSSLPSDPRFELANLLPESAGLSGTVTWQLLPPADSPYPVGTSVNPSGTLVFPRATVMEKAVYVLATDAAGKTAKGRVDISILGINVDSRVTGLIGGVQGGPATGQPTLIDLNSLPSVKALGQTGLMWTLVPGQILPPWITLNLNGTLSLNPSAPADSAMVYLQSVSGNPAIPSSSQQTVLRVVASPVSFDATFVSDLARRSGPALDLNTLLPVNSALSGTLTWTKRSSYSEPQQTLATNVSPLGLLAFPGPSQGEEVLEVVATDPDGNSLVGTVTARSVVSTFTGMLNVDPGQQFPSELDLKSSRPGATNAAAGIWSFAAGHDIPEWISLDPSGVLRAHPGEDELSSTKTFVVQVTGETPGVTSYGLVTVNTLAYTATLFSQTSLPTGAAFDLNRYAGMPLLGTDGTRAWSLLPDVSKPLWIETTPTGQVGLRPSINDERITLVFLQSVSLGNSTESNVIRVICEPVKFGTSVLADLSEITPQRPFVFDLSPLVAGFGPAQYWSPAAGQSEAAMDGLILATSGSLQITSDAQASMGRMLFVEVQNGSGTRRVGGVRFDLVQTNFSLGPVVAASGESTLTYNLNSILAAGTASAGRVWGFIQGQNIPTWMELSSQGLLTTSPPSGTSPNFGEYLVQTLDGGTLNYGKFALNTLVSDGTLQLSAVREMAAPFEVDLNLQTGIPLAGNANGREWSPSVGQVLPFWVTLASTGTLRLQPLAADPAEVFYIDQTGTDDSGTTQKRVIKVVAAPRLLSINSGSLAVGQVGVPIQYQITTDGSPASYGASGLPAGVSINVSTGSLGGSPLIAGSFTATLQALTSAGTAQSSLAFDIRPATPQITSPLLVSTGSGKPFSYQITASPAPVSYAAVGLPSGLSLNTTTGTISGAIVGIGTASFTVEATNTGGTGRAAVTVVVNAPEPTITSSPTASTRVGDAFGYAIAADANPRYYSASGLPAGLGLSAATGSITGVASTAGVFPVTIRAVNTIGTGTASLVITVLNPSATAGTSVNIVESSTPSGITARSSYAGVGSSYTSTTAVSTYGNYRFIGWRLNGTRMVNIAGRAQNPAVFTVSGAASLVAEYALTTADSDNDGLPDWYEQEFFGSLAQAPLADSDGDGLSNRLEYILGFDPGIFDQVVEGGIVRRTGGAITVISSPLAFPVTVVSSPPGFVDPKVIGATADEWVTLPTVSESIGIYRFTGWYSDGVRVDSPSNKQPTMIRVTGPKAVSAVYLSSLADSDLDLLADWYEMFNFGTLAYNGQSNPDGDMVSVWAEQMLGYSPFLFDQVLEGGVARRTSAVLDMSLAGLPSLTIRSSPRGLINDSVKWAPPGSTISTQDLWNVSFGGYRFIGWEIDGQRAVDSTGTSIGSATIVLDHDTVAIARFVSDSLDTDLDGLMDWKELLLVGSLSGNGQSDFEGDGVAWLVENVLGYSPNIFDKVVEGGVSRRTSNILVANLDWRPSILQAPAAASVQLGDPVSFSVSAVGNGTLSYSWKKNGVPIAGAFSSTYSIGQASLGDAGSYTAVASDQYGTSFSAPAALLVRTPTTLGLTVTASAVSGASMDTTKNLGSLLPANSGLSGTVVWSLLGGQNLPAWISLNSAGVLTAKAPGDAGSGSIDIYVKALDSAMRSVIGKVSIDLYGLGIPFAANTSAVGGNSIDLNGNLPSGVNSAVWSLESSAPQFSAGLLHRWSFNEKGGSLLRDSVGTADGSVVTPLLSTGSLQTAVLSSGSVSLNGGDRGFASYVRLPSGLLSGLSSTTIEVWASLNDATPSARIFEIGSGTATSAALMAGFANAGDMTHPVQGSSFSGTVSSASAVAFQAGRIYHWAFVWDAANSQARLYRDGVQISSFSTASHSLSEIADSAFWLGRSHATDATAGATFAEVRLWNRALSATELAANSSAGPDGAGVSLTSAGTLSVQPFAAFHNEVAVSAIYGGTGQLRAIVRVDADNGAVAPLFTGSLSASTRVFDAFEYQVSATGSPTLYTANGLPTGLTINGLTGVISGSVSSVGDFQVMVAAGNEGGGQAGTLSLSVGRTSQTLRMDELAPRTYLDAPFYVGATSSTGLPVTLTVASGSASISSGTVTLLGAGTVTLRAEQSGSSLYLPAQPLERNFLVNPALQTVSFGSLTARTYLDAPLTLGADSSSRLPVSFSVISGPGTLSAGTLAILGAGEIRIRAVQSGSDNFLPSLPVDRVLMVAKAAQSITVGSLASKSMSDEPFPVSGTATSELPVTFTVSSGPAVIDGGTVVLKGAGMVTLRASQPGNENYLPADPVLASFSVSLPAGLDFFSHVWAVSGASVPTVRELQPFVPLGLLSGEASWAFSSGQEIPSWMSLTASGTLTMSPQASVPSGNILRQIEATDALGAKVRGSLSVDVVGLAVEVAGNTYQPGGIGLDLATALPQSVAVGSNAVWTVVGPDALQFTFDSTLVHRWSFNEKAGSVIADSVGSADARILAASGTYGASLSAAVLDSGTVHLQGGGQELGGLISYPAGVLPLSGDFSLEVWRSSDSVSGGSLASFFNVELLASGSLGQFPQRAGLFAFSEGIVAPPTPVAGGSSSLNQSVSAMHHYVVVWDSKLKRLNGYIDGQPFGDGISLEGENLTFDSFRLGGLQQWVEAGTPFAAPVPESYAEVRVWARALNAEDLQRNNLFGPNAGSVLLSQTGRLSVSQYEDVSADMLVRASSQGSDDVLVSVKINGQNLAPAPVINTRIPVSGTYGFPLQHQILASGSASVFESVGLPLPLSLDRLTGIIYGVPAQTGTMTVQVRAENHGGISFGTLGVSIARAPQSISFGTLGPATYLGDPVALTADSSSGLPVAFSVLSGEGTIASGTFTPLAAGSLTIRAFQEGNGNYLPAPFVDRSLTVGKAPQTISFPALSTKTYLDPAFTLEGNSTSGLPLTFSVVDGPATLNGGTLSLVGAGSVTVSAVQTGNSNFLSSQTLYQTFLVRPLPPVIVGTLNATGQMGRTFVYQIRTSGAAPTGYLATGLPAGLVLDAANGSITGTPTVSGSVSVTLSAVNSGGTGPLMVLSLNVLPESPRIVSSLSATAQRGEPFSYAIEAIPAATGYTADGLPAGLGLNPLTGIVSGTLNAEGIFRINLGASNSGGTGTATLVVSVGSPKPVFTSPLFVTITKGSRFEYQITADGNPTAFRLSQYPSWMQVNAQGLVSGEPIDIGVTKVLLEAQNTSGTTSAYLTLTTQLPPPEVPSGLAATAIAGQPFSYSLTATNSALTFAATGLPSGLSVDLNTGLISGTVSASSVGSIPVDFPVGISASNSAGTGSGTLSLRVLPELPRFTSPMVVSGTVGASFNYQITTAGSAASTFSVLDPVLPAGLSFNAQAGVISGTPLIGAKGNSIIGLKATNVSGDAFASLALRVDPATLLIDAGSLSLVAGQPLLTRNLADSLANVGSLISGAVTWTMSGTTPAPSWAQLNASGVLTILVPASFVPSSEATPTPLTMVGVDTAGTKIVSTLNVFVRALRAPDTSWQITSVPAASTLSGTLVTSIAPQGSALLSVGSATSGLEYQWRKDGVPITAVNGGTASTLSVQLRGPDDIATYDVVLRNAAGTARLAGLKVDSTVVPVSLVSNLSNVTLLEGQRLGWNGLTVDGGGTISFEWIQNGVRLNSGANLSINTAPPSLVINSVSLSNAGTYVVRASNSLNQVSTSATLSVLRPGTITSAPANFGPVNPGQSAAFSVRAEGGDPSVSRGGLRYQWYLIAPGSLSAELPISGATGADLNLQSVSAEDNGSRVSVKVSLRDPSTGATLQSVTSPYATLSVRQPVRINGAPTVSPSSGVVNLSGLVTLGVLASGNDVAYQWRRDGVVLAGKTSNTLSFNATEVDSGSYDVVARNLVNEAVSTSVYVKVNLPVTIVTQPTSKTVNADAVARFRVEVKGTSPFTYQWRKDGLPLSDYSAGGGSLKAVSGARTELLTVSGVGEDNQGDYDVVVSNGIGTAAISDVATLAISDSVKIKTHPSDLMVVSGSSATLSVQAEGVSLRYQWRRNGVDVAGATQPTLTLPVTATTDSGDYDVSVASGAISVASQSARLDVLAKVSITAQPRGAQTLIPGQDGTALYGLSVQASSGGTNRYEWFKDGASVPVQSGSSASYTATVTDVPSTYRVRVTASRVFNGGTLDLGSALSSSATVSLMEPASVVAHPLPVSVDSGGGAVMEVSARGGGSLTYQWERERGGRWSTILGAVGNRLTLSELLTSDSGLYRVQVSNERGTVVSDAALLTVREADVIMTQPVSQAVNPGDTAVFSVVAAGKNLSYQWYKSGVSLGQNFTSATLRISDADSNSVGLYEVRVTHAYGLSTSSAARLTLNEPVTIPDSGQPKAPPLVEGGTATLVVKATGTAPLTYQWRKNGGPILANTARIKVDQGTCTIMGAAASDSGLYDVVVRNVVGAVSSQTVKVDVLTGVTIKSVSTLPRSLSDVRKGAGVLFTVEASGSPRVLEGSLQYQWRKDGVPLQDVTGVRSGTRTDSLLIVSADPGNAVDDGSNGKYDVVVTNDVNSAASVPVTLTVVAEPILVRQPVALVVNSGDGARFSVTAKSALPMTYQWYRNGVAVSSTGSTTSELTLSNVVQSGTYHVAVTNSLGSVQSASAKLDLILPLTLPDEADIAAAPDSSAAPVTAAILTKKLGETAQILFTTTVPTQPGVEILYQWRKNGVNLADQPGKVSGSRTTSLSVFNVSDADAAAYDLLISKVSGGAEKSRITSRTTSLRILPPPVISGLASSVLARPNEQVVFAPTVVSSLTDPVSIRWLKGGVEIPEATASQYTIASVSALDAGTYTIRASDANGTRESSVALTVASVLSLDDLPSEIRTKVRSKVTFTAKPHANVADGPLSYQWRLNGAPIRGAVRATYEITSVLASHAGAYDVVVSNNFQRVVSTVCALKVDETLKITTQPLASVTVNPRERLTLSVGVNRTAGVNFQWIKGTGRSAQLIAGGTSQTLVVDPVKNTDEGIYYVLLTEATGRLSSSLTRVVVNKEVTITQQPNSQTVRPGEAAVFVVKATGTGPFSYQWYRDGEAISSAVGDSLSLPSVSMLDAGSYTVGVTNVASRVPVLSRAAELMVNRPATITKEPLDLRVIQGGSIALYVEAIGDGTLTYQWRCNGLELPGETDRVLSRSRVSVVDTNVYDVVVKNTLNGRLLGADYSRKALLQVFENPVFVIPPVGQSVPEGSPATLQAVVEGTGPLQYAWTKDGGTTVLSSSGTITVGSMSAASAGTYTVTVTNPLNISISASASLSLNENTGRAFALEPFSVTGISGGTVRLTTTAGSGYKIIGWRRVVSSPGTGLVTQEILSGGSLTITGASDLDSGVYQALASVNTATVSGVTTGTWGTELAVDDNKFVSSPATVCINPEDPLYKPGVRTTPKSVEWTSLETVQTVFAGQGGATTFRVFPVGAGLSYTWVRTVTNLAGGEPAVTDLGVNKPVLTLRNLVPSDGGSPQSKVTYTCVVRMPDGLGGTLEIPSVPFTLYVQALPLITNQPLAEQVRLPALTGTALQEAVSNRAPYAAETAILSVGGTFSADTTFQWYFRKSAADSWAPVPGASVGSGSISTCLVQGVREVDEGYYRLDATNPVGTVSSNTAHVTVLDPVSIQLISTVDGVPTQDATPGDTVKIIADIGDAAQTGALQNAQEFELWAQSKTTGIWSMKASQASSGTFTLSNFQEANETFYKVRAYGKVNGRVESAPVQIRSRNPAAFASGTALLNTSLVGGDTLALSAAATGDALAYRWYFKANGGSLWTKLTNGGTVSISGGTLRVASLNPTNSGTYGLVLVNGFSRADASGSRLLSAGERLDLEAVLSASAPREIARVAVKTAPSVALPDGVSPTVTLNEGAALAITAAISDSGGSTVRYQWRKNGVLLGSGSSDVVQSSAQPKPVYLSIGSASSSDSGRYDLLVSNAYGSSSGAAYQVSVNARPVIQSQPEPVITSEYGTATFRVRATGTGSLVYAWERQLGGSSTWEPIGVNQPILTLKGVSLGDDASSYRVTITGLGGSVVSTIATLKVASPTDVKLLTQPNGGTVLNLKPGDLGKKLEATVAETSGASGLNYKWRKDGVVILEGGTSRPSVKVTGTPDYYSYTLTYRLPTVTNDTDGVYDLLVDNGAAFASSQAVVVSVNPHIDSLDIPTSANPGDGVTMSVKVRAGDTYDYAWQKDGESIVNGGTLSDIVSGATTESMTIKSLTPAKDGFYRVVVTNRTTGAVLTSASVRMVVASPVQILRHPSLSSAELNVGDRLTLSVEAAGGGSLVYQWFKDGRALSDGSLAASGGGASATVSGSTLNTISVFPVRSAEAGIYQVRVSNAASSEMSNSVGVEVLEKLGVSIDPPAAVNVGAGLNMVATVTGAGDKSLQWSRIVGSGSSAVLRAVPGGTSEQLRINPVTAADEGQYVVTVRSSKSGSSVTSDPVSLVVRKVPVIVTKPVSLTRASGTDAVFSVVARSASLPITRIEWFKGGISTGTLGSTLKVRASEAAEGVYTVKVTNADGTVEASASLRVVSAQNNVPAPNNAGTSGTPSLFTSWWVFWTKGLGTVDSKDRSGYLLMERTIVGGTLSGGTISARTVVPGRSSWILSNRDAALTALGSSTSFTATPDEWQASDQTVTDALDSERSEFSVLAFRGAPAGSNFTIGGRVEKAGDASVYGAPELMAGFYLPTSSDDDGLDVDLVWDAEESLILGGNGSYEDVLTQLQRVLGEVLATLPGE